MPNGRDEPRRPRERCPPCLLFRLVMVPLCLPMPRPRLLEDRPPRIPTRGIELDDLFLVLRFPRDDLPPRRERLVLFFWGICEKPPRDPVSKARARAAFPPLTRGRSSTGSRARGVCPRAGRARPCSP